MSRPDAGSKRRVLLIGLDSADAELIENWIGEGRLPSFARMRREGVYSRLGTTADYLHVSAWPTLYTGTMPGQHGLYHAYQIRAGEQLIHRTEPASAGRPPFWKYLDDAGKRCVIFDAFMDYAIPGFKGVQILDYGTWTWFGDPASNPRGLLGEIKRRFGPYPAPEHSTLVQVPDDTRAFAAQLVAGTEVKSRIVRALMAEQDWDFLFANFGEPHGAGHYLWHVEDRDYPTHPPGAGDRHPVRDVYVAVDRAIGEIMDAADDRTTVLVTSGDGMGPNYSGCHLMPEWLHRQDLYHSGSVGGGEKQSTAPKKGLVSSLRDAVPLEFRQAVMRCMPRSVRYRMSMKWVNSGIDWPRSKVFCIPNSNEGYFRVNLRGREPQGVVNPGAEYDDLLGRICGELEQMRNPANGRTVAERITRTDDVFMGPRRGDLPDALVSWSLPARTLESVESPATGVVIGKAGHAISPFYTGNHRANAFLYGRGPSLAAGSAIEQGHIRDIAPTLLAMLGVDAPGHIEGRSWNWNS